MLVSLDGSSRIVERLGNESSNSGQLPCWIGKCQRRRCDIDRSCKVTFRSKRRCKVRRDTHIIWSSPVRDLKMLDCALQVPRLPAEHAEHGIERYLIPALRESSLGSDAGVFDPPGLSRSKRLANGCKSRRIQFGR